MLKFPLFVSPLPATKLKVCPSPTSTSVALRVPTVALAPAVVLTLVELKDISVGASFVFATVI